MTDILPFRIPRDAAAALLCDRRAFTGSLTGVLAGREPHDFCLHLRFGGDLGVSIASAPIWCRERIAEAGFPSGPAVVLLTGRDLDGASAFATVSTTDWRPTVLRLGTVPSYAFAERVHLLFWIGAIRSVERRAVSAGIGRRLASHGTSRRLGRIVTTHPVQWPDRDAGTLNVLIGVAATVTDMFDGRQP